MLAKCWNLKNAVAYAGKVSKENRKMPGTSFAISPSLCKAGSILATVKGSVCNKCYSLHLEKFRKSVRMGYVSNSEKAINAIAEDPVKWADAIAYQINHHANKTGVHYHRWFDAGDLQSVTMLWAIALVCELTPSVKHWLPTREAKIVADYMSQFGELPKNLVIRMSSTMVGNAPRSNWTNTSTVYSKKKGEVFGHACPANTPEHKALSKDGKTANCGACRACWDKDVPNVSYPLH